MASIQAEYGEFVLQDVEALLDTLKKYKPKERSSVARHFAICITDVEKVKAYVLAYLIGEVEEESENDD